MFAAAWVTFIPLKIKLRQDRIHDGNLQGHYFSDKKETLSSFFEHIFNRNFFSSLECENFRNKEAVACSCPLLFVCSVLFDTISSPFQYFSVSTFLSHYYIKNSTYYD